MEVMAGNTKKILEKLPGSPHCCSHSAAAIQVPPGSPSCSPAGVGSSTVLGMDGQVDLQDPDGLQHQAQPCRGERTGCLGTTKDGKSLGEQRLEGEEDGIHVPSVPGCSVRGRSLTGCRRLRCCRELLRESERLETYLDLPWMWEKGEEGLALGLPKL